MTALIYGYILIKIKAANNKTLSMLRILLLAVSVETDISVLACHFYFQIILNLYALKLDEIFLSIVHSRYHYKIS